MTADKMLGPISEQAQRIADENCGLALKLLQKEMGVDIDTSRTALCWDEERDAMYDDLYRKIVKDCR